MVSSPELYVWCETSFRSLSLNGGRNFRLSLQFPGWCSNVLFTSLRLPTNFQKQLVPLLLPGIGGRNIAISSGFTPAKHI